MHVSDPYTAMVTEFHEGFGHPIATKPAYTTPDLAKLRIDLIKEETDELEAAIIDYDLTGIADALGDLMYVVVGAALVYGIPLLDVFTEIHRSNMSKLGSDGQPIYREDGKILKGPAYTQPDLLPILFPRVEAADQ